MKVSHPRDYHKGREHGMMEVWRETQGSRSKRRGGEGDVSPQAATRAVLLPTQISVRLHAHLEDQGNLILSLRASEAHS